MCFNLKSRSLVNKTYHLTTEIFIDVRKIKNIEAMYFFLFFVSMTSLPLDKLHTTIITDMFNCPQMSLCTIFLVFLIQIVKTILKNCSQYPDMCHHCVDARNSNCGLGADEEGWVNFSVLYRNQQFSVFYIT